MQSRQERNFGGRFPKPKQHSAVATAKTQRGHGKINKRARGGQRNEQLPFIPPEDWYEPTESGKNYRVVVKSPGVGYRHILTPTDVRTRLAELPKSFLKNLEVVQLSGMTRKKQSFPCYGMQWGASLYLYPIEETLVECYNCPPTPAQLNEARMYGGCWVQESANNWSLVWTEESIRDFYLNNILIHELGHLVDDRNTRYVDRERYAEWFALQYGYKSGRQPRSKRAVQRRHHGAQKLA